MADAEADCRALLARLSLYLDGEIAGVDCAEIERHLQDCGPCLRRYGFERDLKELIRATCCERQVPAGLVERVRGLLREL